MLCEKLRREKRDSHRTVVGMQGHALVRGGIPTVLCLLVGALVVRSSWMCDDAFITLASIEQFVQTGVVGIHDGERLQAFTHPLWFAALGGARAIGLSNNAAVFGLSWTLGAAWILALAWMARRHPWRIAFVALCLLASRGWIDFATGGLENPLSNLLLLIFVRALWSRASTWRSCLLATLILWTRLDLAIFVLPLLGFWLLERPHERARSVLLGFALPLFLGLCATSWYFGAALPTSYYAKIATQLPRMEHLSRGAAYVVATFLRDPGTLVVLAILVLRMLYVGGREAVAAVAIVVHGIYVVWIGGDFMSGRMFVPSLTLALAVFVHAAPPLLSRATWSYGLVALMSAFALFATAKTVQLPSAEESQEKWMARTPRGHLLWAVADERWLYSYEYGLFSPHAEWPAQAAVSPRLRVVDGGGGRAAIERRAPTRLIDRVGLLDPFLARLPATPDPLWRTGHALRRLPAGYVETLWSGDNRLQDPRLTNLYGDLSLAARGSLFDLDRLPAILRIARFRSPEPVAETQFEPLLGDPAAVGWSTSLELSGPVQVSIPQELSGRLSLVGGAETVRWSLLRGDRLVDRGFVGPERAARPGGQAGDVLVLEPLCPQAECPRLTVRLEAP